MAPTEKAHSCAHSQHGCDNQKKDDPLRRIGSKIAVMSGKGGVGKSTVAVNLAYALASLGKKVGLLDVDIHGPSVPTMMGIEQEACLFKGDKMMPVEVDSIKVMSIGLFLAAKDDALIWRGPRKTAIIQQLINDTAWGDLDVLVIDSPPGTGDEPLTVCQAIPDLMGAVIVTTPQKIAAIDVRKSITFCRKVMLPVLGVVENMSGFVCPHCQEVTHILPPGGGKEITQSMGVPFLGAIPMDPAIALAGDSGRAIFKQQATSVVAKTLLDIARFLFKSTILLESSMKIAIPLAEGKLTAHFGHCRDFAVIDVDQAQKKIVSRVDIPAPPHEPGLLPPWLADKGVKVIIAGGMGQRAQELFVAQNIAVIVGAPTETPEVLVAKWLQGELTTGENCCDH